MQPKFVPAETGVGAESAIEADAGVWSGVKYLRYPALALHVQLLEDETEELREEAVNSGAILLLQLPQQGLVSQKLQF